jgi:hypothetical protein
MTITFGLVCARTEPRHAVRRIRTMPVAFMDWVLAKILRKTTRWGCGMAIGNGNFIGH